MSVFTKIILSSPDVDPLDDSKKFCEITGRVIAANFVDIRAISAIGLMMEMTGEPLEVCELFIRNKKTAKTFHEWYKEHDMEHSDTHDNSSLEMMIRSVIVHHYIHLRQVPTTEAMLLCLEKDFGSIYNAESLNHLLKRNEFHWKHLNSKKSIILEDPKKCYERRKYLDTIMGLRKDNRHFVYIDDTILKVGQDSTAANVTQPEDLYCYAAVSPSLGLLNSACLHLNSNEPLDVIKVPTEGLVIDKVIYEIPPSSVIVVPDRPYHEKPFLVLPDIHSPKKQMCEWLSHHNVPHTACMHSAQLFELIQRTKRHFKVEKRKFDMTLAMYGHTVVRLPRKTNYLYYFEAFWTDFKNNADVTESWINLVPEALKRVSNTAWLEMENDLIAMENRISQEDEAVENITDTILTMARDEALSKGDLQDCERIELNGCLKQVIFP